MNDILLLKQGEIVLKGMNRKFFEQKLISNISRRLSRLGKFRIYSVQSTIYAEPQSDDIDMDEAEEIMRKTFGIASISRAAACEKDKDAILAMAKEYLCDALLQGRIQAFRQELPHDQHRPLSVRWRRTSRSISPPYR